MGFLISMFMEISGIIIPNFFTCHLTARMVEEEKILESFLQVRLMEEEVSGK